METAASNGGICNTEEETEQKVKVAGWVNRPWTLRRPEEIRDPFWKIPEGATNGEYVEASTDERGPPNPPENENSPDNNDSAADPQENAIAPLDGGPAAVTDTITVSRKEWEKLLEYQKDTEERMNRLEKMWAQSNNLNPDAGKEPVVFPSQESSPSDSCSTTEDIPPSKPDKPSEFRCLQCNAVFTTEKKLGRHDQTHVKKTLRCERCGVTFARSGSLQRHLRSCRPHKPQDKDSK